MKDLELGKLSEAEFFNSLGPLFEDRPELRTSLDSMLQLALQGGPRKKAPATLISHSAAVESCAMTTDRSLDNVYALGAQLGLTSAARSIHLGVTMSSPTSD